MLEVKLMNEEQMAKAMALSLNLMVEQIKKTWFRCGVASSEANVLYVDKSNS